LAGTAGIQLPWMAIHIRHTEFDRHILPVVLIPAIPAVTTDLLFFLHSHEMTDQIKTQP
jgi:hypothetical protein